MRSASRNRRCVRLTMAVFPPCSWTAQSSGSARILSGWTMTRRCTQHLLEQGFDEIHFVVQPFEHVSSRRLREAAFRDVLRTSPAILGDTLVLDLDDDAQLEHALAVLDQRIVAA